MDALQVLVVSDETPDVEALEAALADADRPVSVRVLGKLADLFDELCYEVVHCLLVSPVVEDTGAVDVALGVRGLYPDLPVVVAGGGDGNVPDDLDVTVVDADSVSTDAAVEAVAAHLAGDVSSDAARPPSRMETMLLSMFDGFPVHLYAKDERARHLMVSRHANEPTDLLGLTDLEYDELPKEHREAAYRDEMEVIEDGEERLDVEEFTDFVDSHTLTSKVPWYGPDRDVVGLVGITQDITERKQREHAARRQHELLAKVALVAAHELRNELQVAYGRLELVDEDPAHVEAIKQSHGRLANIVDTVVELASEERSDRRYRPVWFSTLSREVWATLDSGEATLRVAEDARVRVETESTSLLLQILLSNALEHAGQDMTVTVGASADRFFVADDGAGIDVDPPERVFDAGYSTDEHKTGFGLFVARSIADDHGWSLVLSESEAGGARFDVGGLRGAEQPGE